MLCSHKLGTGIIMSNNTACIKYKRKRSQISFVKKVLKMGSSLNDRFWLLVQKVCGYCDDLSYISFL